MTKIARLLGAVLAGAVEAELLAVSPAAGMRVTLPPAPTDGWTFLTQEEIERIWVSRSLSIEARTIYLTLIYTALRKGEAWGLRWSDLDETLAPGNILVSSSGFDEFEERSLYESSAGYPYLRHSGYGLLARAVAVGAGMTHEPGARPLGALDASGYEYSSFRVGRVYGSSEQDLELLVTMDGDPASVGVFTPDVARIPSPPDHSGVHLTAMRTLRIPIACMEAPNPELDRAQVSTVAIRDDGNWAFVVDGLAFQN